MYKFHYDFVKNKYPGQQSALCFTDTDSFLYKIKSYDVPRDMLENHEHFDFSGYPDNHPCFEKLEDKEISGKDDILHNSILKYDIF